MAVRSLTSDGSPKALLHQVEPGHQPCLEFRAPVDRVLLSKEVEDGVRVLDLELAQVFVARGTQ